MLELPVGHAKLAWWFEKRNKPCKFMGDLLQVPATTVWRWCSGERVPETHYRMAIEIITEAYVKAVDWLTADQIAIAFLGNKRKVNSILRARNADHVKLRDNGRSV